MVKWLLTLISLSPAGRWVLWHNHDRCGLLKCFGVWQPSFHLTTFIISLPWRLSERDNSNNTNAHCSYMYNNYLRHNWRTSFTKCMLKTSKVTCQRYDHNKACCLFKLKKRALIIQLQFCCAQYSRSGCCQPIDCSIQLYRSRLHKCFNSLLQTNVKIFNYKSWFNSLIAINKWFHNI